jgi:hypothetical protein
MSLTVKELRRVAWACLGLSVLPGALYAETMNANKQPTGAVTNPPVNPYNPWDGPDQPAFNPWKGGTATEEQARANSACGNCDTDWCNTNYGRGYEGLPLPAWTDLPPWYVGADALFLTRDGNNDLTFATTGQDGFEAVTTEDLDYELRPGARLTIGRSINNYFRIEGTYFGQHYWDDSVSVRNLDPNDEGGLGNLFSPFSGFGDPDGIVGLDYNNLVTINTTTELDSAEMNLRYRAPVRCGAWELIALCGVRYMRIDESFGYLSQSSSPTPLGSVNDIEVETSNDLVGGQIGGNVIYRASERWWINFDGKAGVFGNAARQNTVYAFTNSQGVTTTTVGEAQEGTTAFVGDIKVESCFQLFPRLTVVAGYNAIGVDGLALGASNLQQDINLLTLGPADVNHNGTVIYHGPHAGLVWAW